MVCFSLFIPSFFVKRASAARKKRGMRDEKRARRPNQLPQLKEKEMNLRNEWSKEFLSAASSIKIKDFVCRWSWLWLICPAALSLLSLIPPLACLYFSLCWLINWRAAVRERVKEVKGVVFGLASLGRKSITVYSVIKNLWFLWRRQWSCATKHTTSLPFQRKIKVFFFFSIQWSEMFVLLRWVGNKKIL